MSYNKQIKFLTINSKAKWKRDLLLYCNTTKKESERFTQIDNSNYNTPFEIRDDGIALKSHLTFQMATCDDNTNSSFSFDNNEHLEIIDLTSDHCGVLYTIAKNDNTKDIPQKETSNDDNNDHHPFTKYKIQTLNSKSHFVKETQKNFDNPIRIESGLQYIYILDNDKIQILSKRNHQTKFSISLHTCNNPLDITLDDKDNLYILDENNIIYRLEPESQKIVPIFNQESQGSSTGQNIPIDKITIGKKNNELYALSVRNHTLYKISKSGVIEKTIIPAKSDLIEDTVNHRLFVYDNDNCFLSGIVVNTKDDDNPLKILKIDSNGDVTSILDSKDGPISMNKSGTLYHISKYGKNLSQYMPIFGFPKYVSFITKRFDSTKHDTRWHKIVLDSEIPENTVIEISHYTTNEDIQITEEHVPSTQLINELSNNTKNDDNFFWSKPIINPRDTLIDANGRYLWLKITLRSIDESSTPALSAATVFFPRMSYLRYLPSIYSEDKTSRNFLERFLSLFETISDDVDAKISNLPKLFDPKTTPADFIPWLSSWLAFGFDDRWPLNKTRLLLRHLPELYKMRGTRKGLEKMLLIYLHNELDYPTSRVFNNYQHQYFGGNPVDNYSSIIDNKKSAENLSEQTLEFNTREKIFTIIENFQLECANQSSQLKEYKRLFEFTPYHFYILLNSLHITDEAKNVIKTIVDSERPAHTVGQTIFLNPWFILGEHLYLGVNTYLNKRDLVIGRTILGRDSVIPAE